VAFHTRQTLLADVDEDDKLAVLMIGLRASSFIIMDRSLDNCDGQILNERHS
jgi:hypothetical protein